MNLMKNKIISQEKFIDILTNNNICQKILCRFVKYLDIYPYQYNIDELLNSSRLEIEYKNFICWSNSLKCYLTGEGKYNVYQKIFNLSNSIDYNNFDCAKIRSTIIIRIINGYCFELKHKLHTNMCDSEWYECLYKISQEYENE